ncbi:Low-density lipoprotein receptor-related protein 4 [Mactra antiquata]
MTKLYIFILSVFLLSGHLRFYQVLCIPDKSLVWTSGLPDLYYSSDARNWTNALISAQEFSQTLKKLSAGTGAHSLYGIAADTSRQHFILVDKGSRVIDVLDINAKKIIYFHLGTSPDIGQVAVDWRGRNVYWTDTGYGWIAMKKLPVSLNTHDSTDHRFKVILNKYLQQPSGIAVHPHEFYLFWADKGGSPQIERSNMVGKERRVIIWQGLITPTTLCIDITSERLYWSDPGRGTIEYSNFNGDDRTILRSDPGVHYYGIAIFQESLIYTIPSRKHVGYVSLRESIEGEHIQAILEFQNITLYHVLAYDTDLQPREDYEGCDTDHPEVACDQLCYHAPQDQGRSCLCYDGYDLVLNQKCRADGDILQRHILFTNRNQICAIPISLLGLRQNVERNVSCNIVTSDRYITRFSSDMTNKVVYFTDGTSIYKQKAFDTDKTILYNATSDVTDMDFDWKTNILYWIQRDDRHIYYMNIDTQVVKNTDFDVGNDATTIAVDPYKRQLFWIDKSTESTYQLYKWTISTEKSEEIPVTLLANPTDLEYDRIRQRLLWNDNRGYIGMINTDSTGETKYDINKVTGRDRYAVAMYKNYILASSAESGHFDVIYELGQDQFNITLDNTFNREILDLHVYETALQPMDLEPCERDNNGGCEHICIPDPDVLKCECLLGYKLAKDGKSCITEVLTTNYFIVLDSKHDKIYQIDRTAQTVYTVEIDTSNIPSTITLDSSRNTVVWVDGNNGILKKKKLGMAGEIAVKTGIDHTSAVAIDMSTGNIYVSTDNGIEVINDNKDSTVVIDKTDIEGTVGKLTLHPQAGQMAWYEYGNAGRIMLANMDGSKVEIVLDGQHVGQPDDLTFDLEDADWLFWCDSERDIISKIDLKSYTSTNVYQGRGLKPIAIDIKGSFVYLAPRNERKIVRLNKSTGQNQRVVLESPLFGTFSNFFLYQDNIKAHRLCGDCNGGCSNICLPSGERIKHCRCSNGFDLEADKVTCEHATVCKEDTYNTVEGLNTLEGCCPNSMLHDNVCKPTCLDNYEVSNRYIKCISGVWNHTLNNICRRKNDNTGGSVPVVYIAAAVAGVLILIIVVVVVVCIYRKKMSGGKSDRRRLQESPYTDSEITNSPYASPVGAPSPDPPPRREEVEEVYDDLNEMQMEDVSKLRVALPNGNTWSLDKKEKENGSASDHKERYSRFPGKNGGYITTPDVAVGDDGYLAACSISGGSFHGAPSGESFHGGPSGESFRGGPSGGSFHVNHSDRLFQDGHSGGSLHGISTPPNLPDRPFHGGQSNRSFEASDVEVGDDGYLAASSISGGSFHGGSSGESFHVGPSGESFRGGPSGGSFHVNHSDRSFQDAHSGGSLHGISIQPNPSDRSFQGGHSNGLFEKVDIRNGVRNLHDMDFPLSVRYTRQDTHVDRKPPKTNESGVFDDNRSGGYRSGSGHKGDGRRRTDWTA